MLSPISDFFGGIIVHKHASSQDLFFEQKALCVGSTIA
jgi:hypothetical protein